MRTFSPVLSALLLASILAACTTSSTFPNGPGGKAPNGGPARALTVIVGNVCNDDVTTYGASFSGNVTPTFNLNGAATLNADPYNVFNQSGTNLWVSNYDPGSPSVTEFSLTANGDTAPTNTIAGAATTFVGPTGIFVDNGNTIYVADYNNDAIDIFTAGSTGDVAPARQIKGAATLLDLPESLSLDSHGNIWVANAGGGGGVLEFANNAATFGNVPPEAEIAGATTTLTDDTGLAIDTHNNVWVTDYGTDSILEFAAGSTGDVAPTRTISGASTDIEGPYGVALDKQGYIYEVGVNLNQLNIFAPNASGDAAPVQSIAGASTDLDCPSGITLSNSPPV